MIELFSLHSGIDSDGAATQLIPFQRLEQGLEFAIAKPVAFLACGEDFAAFNRVCSTYSAAPSSARTTIFCSLPAGVSVAVDGVVVLG